MVYEHIKYRLVDIDAAQAREDAAGMIEGYPWRGPAAAVHAMAPYIFGKVVCDLGCGGGDLAWLMGRWAAKVIGIEVDRKRYVRAVRTERTRGRPLPLRDIKNVTIEKQDYFKDGVPDADVYYFWPNDSNMLTNLMDLFESRVADRNPSVPRPFLIIAGGRPGFLDSEKEGETFFNGGATRRCHLLKYVDIYDGEVIRVPFHENSELSNWPDEDEWCLCIIPMGGAKL